MNIVSQEGHQFLACVPSTINSHCNKYYHSLVSGASNSYSFPLDSSAWGYIPKPEQNHKPHQVPSFSDILLYYKEEIERDPRKCGLDVFSQYQHFNFPYLAKQTPGFPGLLV